MVTVVVQKYPMCHTHTYIYFLFTPVLETVMAVVGIAAAVVRLCCPILTITTLNIDTLNFQVSVCVGVGEGVRMKGVAVQ